MKAAEIRAVGDDEREAVIRAVGTAFGDEPEPAQLAHWLAQAESMLGAYDGASVVGGAMTLSFALTVPGGEVDTAAVTGVGVVPSHRRRGILTGLMRQQLDDARSLGKPLAALWASEAVIYGRFGYGVATKNAQINADRDRSGVQAGPEPEGEVRLVPHDEALEVLPQVYDRVRSLTPGFYTRSRDWWEHEVLPDEEPYRRGSGPLFRAVLELEGEPQAYALYRIKPEWADSVPASTLTVVEDVSTTPQATRELWSFLFGVDLIARVASRTMPPDHPLFLLAGEPARLRFRLEDGMWLRFVDVRDALEARLYAGEGLLVLDVLDEFCPWNTGCFELTAGEDGAAVSRAAREPDLRLTISNLASAYLGGFSFLELARAGRVDELQPGALARADALFRVERTPWCPGLF